MHDAIIVGAGPAGSACALLLARQGWDVLLLDRADFPRDKPCGEFLTPACRAILEDLGVWRALGRNGLSDVPAMRLHAPSGKVAEYRPLDAEPAGYAVRRTILDRLLLCAAADAGVAVGQGCAVRGLLREGERVTGVRAVIRDSSVQEIPARIVIGADGTHSIVARSLGLVRVLRRLQRLAIVSHWRGLPVESIEMRSAGGIVCGVAGLKGAVANVTVVARTQEAARIAGRPQEYVSEVISERFPELAEQMVRASMEPDIRTIGCFGHVADPAYAAGALLVGDAAAFIDPFTGEGVYFALRGAELAYEVANDCLRASDLSAAALSAYHLRRTELRRRYLLCGLVQTVVRTPFLMNRVVRRCGKEPVTLARLMEALGDVAPPSRVLQPAFAARLFY